MQDRTTKDETVSSSFSPYRGQNDSRATKIQDLICGSHDWSQEGLQKTHIEKVFLRSAKLNGERF